MEKKAEEIGLVAIDSSIFVDHLRGYLPSVEFFRNPLFSAITETELIAGKSCNESDVKIMVLNMLNSITKIEVNNKIALKAGDLSRVYGTDLPDSIIAATAIVMKAELLTKNIKDFEKIKELRFRAPY